MAFPFPQGAFLVVIFSFFVGNGIGPLGTIPDLLEISLIESHKVFRAPMSMLASFILAIAIFLKKDEDIKSFRKSEST